MPAAKTTIEEFVRIWHEEGQSPTAVARALNVSPNNVFRRRVYAESLGYSLPTNPDLVRGAQGGSRYAYPRRQYAHVEDGYVLCFGDLHSRPLAWREGDTVAMQTLLAWLEVYGRQVSALVCMGDATDMAAISRHPPIGWQEKPSIEDEIGGAQHDLRRIADLAPQARRLWVLGNHDERYDRFLATRSPEFRNVVGFSYADAFRDWDISWSVMVNASLLLLHRWHSGVHAVHSNLVKGGGVHVGTGDTHRLRVYPYSGQAGTLWGFETGTLADPEQSFFEYTRGLDPNWQPGFVVCRFRDGALEMPQAVLAGERFRVVVGGSR